MMRRRCLRWITVGLNAAEGLSLWVGCLMLWSIVGLIFTQVALRWGLLIGLSWSDELARFFHIALVVKLQT